jgi:tetratricopeptide (TPR) repeat protein
VIQLLALLALPPALAQDPGGTPATTTPSAGAEPAPASSGTPEQQAVDKINLAVSLLNTQTADSARKALTMLDEASRLDPEQAWAWYNKGVAHQILSEEARARQAWLRTTDIDPALGDAWLQMGLLSLQSGEHDRALTSFRAGLRSDDDNMALRVAQASVLRELDRLPEAEEAAKEGLRINANYLDLYNVLGVVYIEMDKLPLAAFILDKAVRDVPNGAMHADIQTNLGRVLELQGYGFDAQLKYQEALKLDADNVTALVYLARGYSENRNYADAVPLLERARGLAQQDANIPLNLGVAYRGVGRFEDAQKMYEESLRLNPVDPGPYLNLGILLGDYVKDYDGAVVAYQAFIDNGGADPEAIEVYIKATEKEKKKVKRLQDRRKKADSDKAAKAERERLVAEEEANEAAVEEAARQAEAATPGPPAPGPPAPTPEGSDGTETDPGAAPAADGSGEGGESSSGTTDPATPSAGAETVEPEPAAAEPAPAEEAAAAEPAEEAPAEGPPAEEDPAAEPAEAEDPAEADDSESTNPWGL